MKPNILVPMAGLGSRFIKEGFKVPKQLINIKDKHLIDISLDCLDYEGCNLIFVVRDETVYNFHMDELLRKKFGDDVKIVVLDSGKLMTSILKRRPCSKNPRIESIL